MGVVVEICTKCPCPGGPTRMGVADVLQYSYGRGYVMAGLGLFGQKNAIAATTPIATAFKFCIRHRKMGSLIGTR
jgi:hypothetical protein